MVKNKILIIAGMHRAGTSIVSEWLHACGLPLGDKLLQADADHENNYFEDTDFLNAHMAILKGRRLPATGFTAAALRPLSYNEKDRLKDIISYKNGFNYQWGWKDPRNCLFLDTYRDLVPAAFYFVVIRDYQSVINSLIHYEYRQRERKYALRTGISRFVWDTLLKKRAMESLRRKYSQHYLKIWITYSQCILQHVQHLPEDNFLVTDRAGLCTNDKTVFRKLTVDWGFRLSFVAFKNFYKDPLVNASFNIDAFIRDAALIRQARDIEENLRRLSHTGIKHHGLVAV